MVPDLRARLLPVVDILLYRSNPFYLTQGCFMARKHQLSSDIRNCNMMYLTPYSTRGLTFPFHIKIENLSRTRIIPNIVD